MSSFEGENMQTQYNALGYKVYLYFHDYKLAIELDENWNRDRNIDYKMKRQKSIKQELGRKVFVIDPNKGDFNILRAINEIIRHVKQLTKKTLKNKISQRLLGLEFK